MRLELGQQCRYRCIARSTYPPFPIHRGSPPLSRSHGLTGLESRGRGREGAENLSEIMPFNFSIKKSLSLINERGNREVLRWKTSREGEERMD